MIYRLLADCVMILHCAFILFVVFGGLLLLRWPKLVYLHLPAALWGFVIELTGWSCPLTPAENQLREAAGEAFHVDNFIEHYLLPMLYPEGLTREMQYVLAGLVVAINLGIYSYLRRRMWRAHQRT